MKKPQYDLIVFDLAGTLIDEGSNGPIAALQYALAIYGYSTTEGQIRADMGMSKRAHIRKILTEAWSKNGASHGMNRRTVDELVENIHCAFEDRIIERSEEFAKPIEGALELLTHLRRPHGNRDRTKVALTTGYPRKVKDSLLHAAASQYGMVQYDASTSSSEVSLGRPAPFMIYESMMKTGTADPRRVIKVGDTAVDMQAGKTAGAFCIGLAGTGNLSTLSNDEAFRVMTQAGADVMVEDHKALATLLIEELEL